MKKILADPTAPKQKKNGRWPWSYNAPTKDQAHSGFLSAGNDYGVGHRNPVGKEKASSYEAGPIPQQSKCFSPNEIFQSEDKRG
jgi:hypothetical protein